MSKQKRVTRILEALNTLYPVTKPHLKASNPWELLVATVLSAQCTDARVNMVTPELFRRFPSPAAFAAASQEEMEEVIRSTGFYRNKAKHLIAAAQKLLTLYNGKVPESMKELIVLDGVARKTANVVLWNAFGKNEGLAVDTHVARIAARLGLCKPGGSQEQVERELCALFPRSEWGNVNHRMVSFGRDVCIARSPRCTECPLQDCCPQVGIQNKIQQRKKA